MHFQTVHCSYTQAKDQFPNTSPLLHKSAESLLLSLNNSSIGSKCWSEEIRLKQTTLSTHRIQQDIDVISKQETENKQLMCVIYWTTQRRVCSNAQRLTIAFNFCLTNQWVLLPWKWWFPWHMWLCRNNMILQQI